MKSIAQNQVAEWAFESEKKYEHAFTDIEVFALFTEPDGSEKVIPAFWGGGSTWKIRYSSSRIGLHLFRLNCSDAANESLHGQTKQVEVTVYKGENALYKHGNLQMSDDRSYLQHEDGKPFFWLADTWWMGFTKRLSYPEEFQLLTKDRVKKGFSVVQIVAGLFPDMDPLDERGANEAGLPWDHDFTQINPSYFDLADLKIAELAENGLVPCLVGCWGYYLSHVGLEVIQRHWDYILARYAAYPVVWCIAGEANMPFYQSEAFKNPELKLDYIQFIQEEWTKVMQYVEQKDSFHRVITIHPSHEASSRQMVVKPDLLSLDMLQTGHSSYLSLEATVHLVQKAVAEQPRIPVINSEVCYEGLGGTSYQDIQRFLFWSCVLSGACGHSYGANGIWQVNSADKPYGISPTGVAWGNTSWQEAYLFPGSEQVGIGKKLLEKYRWWEFTPHIEWLEEKFAEQSYLRPYAAGIPGEVRLIFAPFPASTAAWVGVMVRGIENDAKYRAYYFDPLTGDETDLGTVAADSDGNWKAPSANICQDWILVLEKV